MGALVLGEIKRKASSFLQTARLALTDVTPAELLAEEATNNDPRVPNAKIMTRITDASFQIDDYWRIVAVIRRRLYSIDWKQWRQFYKTLVLLDFLLTHGPQDFAEEFQSDTDAIHELGTFTHIDENGFDWGSSMQEKVDRILDLLAGGSMLKEARLKALKITKEIQGFGNLIASPSASSSSSSSYCGTPRTPSFGSYSTGSPRWTESDELYMHENQVNTKHRMNCEQRELEEEKPCPYKGINQKVECLHTWDCPTKEAGSLLDAEEGHSDNDEDMEEAHSLIATIF